jgi:hypothetical protein
MRCGQAIVVGESIYSKRLHSPLVSFIPLYFLLDEKVNKESLPDCRGQAGRHNPACTAVSAGREASARSGLLLVFQAK